ncbi:MAG: PepSY-associated TM helix domain-containing protein [Paracoccus sp. (in: a-proteobacteria)]
MTDTTHGALAPAADPAVNRYYFVAWRWHFYAALYVIPFLTMLAVTGLTMLWISWSAGIGAERMAVTPTGTPLAASTLQSAAEAAIPGARAFQYIAPLAPDRVAVFGVVADGTRTGIALDPYSGEVLHSFAWRAGWYDFLTDIHGSLLLGTAGDWLIEIAASLGLVLVATGLYLHWPRGRTGWRDTLLPRRSARGRALWKSLHGMAGFWISAVLVVFLISGLSWAGIWGTRMVQAWNTFPAEKWEAPLSDKTHATMNHGAAKEVPWTLEQTPLPVSGSPAGSAAIGGEPTLDKVAEFALGLGFGGRFQIALPEGDTGVWTVSHDSMSNDGPDPAADRTIHIDRYSGNVLADIRYADYSPYARAMAWGIAFHEGDLGLWNLALNTGFCLGIVFLAISGLVMWWKRRPARAQRLAAPPRPQDLPFWKGAAALVALLSLLFPLAGLAILTALLLDATLLRLLPGLRRAVS